MPRNASFCGRSAQCLTGSGTTTIHVDLEEQSFPKMCSRTPAKVEEGERIASHETKRTVPKSAFILEDSITGKVCAVELAWSEVQALASYPCDI
jgi:hypothetical protein